ncbi:hypothetical protein BS333_14535 [Vibrio azureus]|uniref:DUF2913 domain-containing protein n=1 Tax=Vibrio azureus NBRC 104587 TaxID=1219077 RepID=U3AWZ9_9VIBR|nr:DUF2913 family protein [Vibrio azureus]AUI87625.1 hypothetical protein BS333_14535 [Vibrio azureus]GAD77742.1 hypothetical protein VAZ01S_088_00090 [Vibrio azureus NBRC 104587]
MHSSKQARLTTEANRLLSETALHALLHLYFKLENSSRSFPLAERNELLQKWLKPKQKSPRYKLIKKQLKALTQQAKNNSDSLEKLLSRCINSPQEGGFHQPHLDSYLLLINEIEKKLGTTVLLSRPEDVDLSHDQHGCLLCVLSNDLNQHFDNSNTLTNPISMLFRGPMSQRSLFLGSIYANNTFAYEVQYQDEQFVRITLNLA